jgi:hypothetical protein
MEISQWYAVFSAALNSLPMVVWVMKCGLGLMREKTAERGKESQIRLETCREIIDLTQRFSYRIRAASARA